MNKKFQFDVFVSHNKLQKPRVREIVHHLRQVGLKVFFDEDSIEPGENIVLALEKGLEDSRHVLLFVSPTALSSKWVALERAATLYSDPDSRKRRLIPVMLESVPRNKMGPLLQGLRTIDLTDPNSRDENYRFLLEFLCGRFGNIPGPWEADNSANPMSDVKSPSAPNQTDPPSSGGVTTATQTDFVELRINRPFESFTKQAQDHLLMGIRQLLQAGDEVRIVSKKRGSVLVVVEMPTDLVEVFVSLVKAGRLSEFGADDASLTNAPQTSTVASGADLLKNSSIYREFQAEREEILRHKWIESERTGRDIGFEQALTDWIIKHRANWRKNRQRSVEN